MGNVTYTSVVTLERVVGPLRSARLPAESEPILFGTHGAVARHYGVHGEVADPHATTLDYIVASAAG
ncbi:MAG: hypothetical protein NVS1B4_02770 [Gemmatimonadaceae bacterium]